MQIVVLYCLGNNDKKKSVDIQHRSNFLKYLFVIHGWLNTQMQNPWTRKADCTMFYTQSL
jgi:hypothetical protein